MCGRYVYNFEKDLNNFENNIRNDIKVKTGEIFPTDIAPILIQNKLDFSKWGFKTFDNKLIINTRSETITTKKMFSNLFNSSRCLIPANYYYEWQKIDSKKIKHKIYLNNKDNIYLAGIYKKIDNLIFFSIITKDAESSISNIHSRMPVIIEEKNINIWYTSNNANSLIELFYQNINLCYEPIL